MFIMVYSKVMDMITNIIMLAR